MLLLHAETHTPLLHKSFLCGLGGGGVAVTVTGITPTESADVSGKILLKMIINMITRLGMRDRAPRSWQKTHSAEFHKPEES